MMYKPILWMVALGFAFAVTMVPGVVHGTVLIQKDLTDLVVESSDIVVGEVLETGTGWNAEETRIYTKVVLLVEKGIKGEFQSGEKVQFQTIGGKVDDVELRVPASPRFRAGERVVVFFGGEPNVNTPVTGWEQGKFTVVNGILLENGRELDDFLEEIHALMDRLSR